MGAPLHGADGSSTYSANGYTVIGSVNGPLEVQRRDELPEEATLDVLVRPAIGVGTTTERQLEMTIQSLLRRVILSRQFPRTLIQITLQIISMPDQLQQRLPGVSPTSSLPVLPALLQASLLSLLSASIPLETVFATTTKSLGSSYHVFSFSGQSGLLLAESEGDFDLEIWETACEEAERQCSEMISSLRTEWKR